MQKIPPIYYALACLILLTADIKAEESPSRWSLSGFGTIGGIATDTNAIGFYRNFSQLQDAKKSWEISTDSRLGLQLDFKASESLHATIQWIARDHAGDFFEQNLEWAFLRWSPRSDISIRAGRLGIDTFLLADHTNVGYAYPWMRPPHEFYSYLPVSHFDGIDIKKSYHINEGYLSLKLFAGYSQTALRVTNLKGDLSDPAQGPLVGGNLTYNTTNWQAKLSYTYVQMLNELIDESELKATLSMPAASIILPNIINITPHFSTKNLQIHFVSVGGTYEDGLWLLQAEASYIDSTSVFMPPQTSAYLSIGRRFSDVTLYALYSVAQGLQNKVVVPDPAIPNASLQLLRDTLDTIINNNGTDEQSVSLGLRWDFYQNVAFKAQWSHFWLGSNSRANQWNKPLFEPTPTQVNVWSVGLDFIF